MKLYLSLIFALVSSALLAATPNDSSKINTHLTGEIYANTNSIKGVQFFNDEWTNSHFELTTGETVYNKKLKYNIMLDELIFYNDDINQQIKLDKPLIFSFVVKNKNGIDKHFIKVNLPQNEEPVFAELAVDGKYTLYIQHTVRMQYDYVNIDGINYRQPTTDPITLYYIKTDDNQFFTINKIKKRNVLNIFPDKKWMSQLIKKNRLKMKSENDLIKLIETMNNDL